MQKLEGSKFLLEIEVPAEEVDKAFQVTYRNIAKKVNIPGFRKGKAPKKILDVHIGKEAIKEEAFETLLPKAYYKALEEQNIEPVDRPEVELVKLEEGENCIFKATVQGLPEVTLGQYKDLGIKKELDVIGDEAVENELKTLQEKHATLATTDREDVQEGDTVSLDFEGRLAGELIEGGSATGYSLEIGSKTFIPGFEEQLVGIKLGEEKEIEVTFPADYHKEDLAGKDVIFKVKVTEIKVKEKAELNDDFAKEVSEFTNLDELKKDIREKLEKHAEYNAEREFIEQLIGKVVENAQVEIPQVMIENEAKSIREEFQNRLQQQGFSYDQYKALAGVDEEKIEAQFKTDAEKRVRTNLILEEVAKAEGFLVGEEEVDEEINQIAQMVGRPVAELKKYFAFQGDVAGLKREILRKKAIDFLKEIHA